MKTEKSFNLMIRRALVVSPGRSFYFIIILEILKGISPVWSGLEPGIDISVILALYILVFLFSIFYMILETKPEQTVTNS